MADFSGSPAANGNTGVNEAAGLAVPKGNSRPEWLVLHFSILIYFTAFHKDRPND